jgi:pimeloyl-ACP methyl ester carboxylesterase
MLITTSHGNTIYYEMNGPEDGPLVVLVHGISIPSYSWDHIVPTLVQAGLRVLRYDVFGRGESSYPRGPYDRALLMSQLDDLLRAVSPEQEKVNLAGFSFGGAMSALFTSLNPSRVERLALVAPFARMSPQVDFRRTMRFPVLGEFLMHFKLKSGLLARGNKLLADAGLPEPCAQKFAAQLARPEFARAFLSLLRSDALNDYGPAFAAVAASGVMTALAWGTADDDITAESIAYTRHHLDPKHYEEMQGATHGSMLANSSGVGEFLVKTFTSPR